MVVLYYSACIQKTYWILSEWILAKHFYHTIVKVLLGMDLVLCSKVALTRVDSHWDCSVVKQQRRDPLPSFLLLFWAASPPPLPLVISCTSGSFRSLSWEYRQKAHCERKWPANVGQIKVSQHNMTKHHFSIIPQALHLLDMHATSWHRPKREENCSTMSQHCFVSLTYTCIHTLPCHLHTVASPSIHWLGYLKFLSEVKESSVHIMENPILGESLIICQPLKSLYSVNTQVRLWAKGVWAKACKQGLQESWWHSG